MNFATINGEIKFYEFNVTSFILSYMDFDIIHVPYRITYELHYIDGISMA